MNTIVSRTLSVHQEHALLLELETAGLDAELAQKVIDAKGNDAKDNKLAISLVAFLRNGQQKPKPQDTTSARRILGDDYISPQEVAEARGLSYSQEQLQSLADTLPNEEQLRWLNENNYALVAGPPTEMSLLDVRSHEQTLFYTADDVWYAKNQPFAVNEKVGCKWLAIRKTEVPNFLSKTWDGQRKLLSKDEEVPSAVQMSWFITTYYKVRGVYLFKRIYVWTSSVPSDGHPRISVGVFSEGGLSLHGCWKFIYEGYYGLSASRKF